MTDYYKTLGVTRTSPQSEIKKSYREMAFKYHPDKNPGNPAAEERFKEISEAYSVLGDPEKKSRYDMGGYASQTASGQYQTRDNPFEDFSRTYYGPFGGSGDWQRPQPEQYTKQQAFEMLLRSVLTMVGGTLLLRFSLFFGIFGFLICVTAIGKGFINTLRAIRLLLRSDS